MTSLAGTHVFRTVREFVASVAKVDATAFPPPLWGRDRERGTGEQEIQRHFAGVSMLEDVEQNCSTWNARTDLRACGHPSPCPSPTRGEGTMWHRRLQHERCIIGTAGGKHRPLGCMHRGAS